VYSIPSESSEWTEKRIRYIPWYSMNIIRVTSTFGWPTEKPAPINTSCSHRYVPSVLWRCCLGGRKGIRPVKKLSGGVLAWLSVWSEVQTCIWPSWCHFHSLCLASVKSRLVLPFWYWLTWVVPEKGPLNGCVCVCSHGYLAKPATSRMSEIMFWCWENIAFFGRKNISALKLKHGEQLT